MYVSNWLKNKRWALGIEHAPKKEISQLTAAQCRSSSSERLSSAHPNLVEHVMSKHLHKFIYSI